MFEKRQKSCPICTEEMDLTDQQLKPCKCGYEICVWCWHHIMEMAEKDGTEGRCPACRTPYDKERIVAMSANCQRMVAEMNSQQKKKMHKLKPKLMEGRKHLSDVRVIQRNLVYIIGLPLNLADDGLLQHREYFGRYGKVLKVSISRTSTGVIQHSANNSCCVYITYSKDTEAVRCIQSVHCYVLDGRSLRACFGTTKYCHAWLRNVPCSNRECLYLHDFGSQEDSFTKDGLVLAFARSRVPQIIGATNNLYRRSGNVLPPSVDELRNASALSATRPIKNENRINRCRSFGNSSNTGGFPPEASWVTRVSGSGSPVSSSCSPGLAHRIAEGSNDRQSIALGTIGLEIPTLEARRSAETKDNADVHSGGSLFTSGQSENYTSLDTYASVMNNNGDLGSGKFSIRMSCSLPSCKGDDPATNMPASWKHIVVDDLQNLGAVCSSSGESNNTLQTRNVPNLLETIDQEHSYFLQQNDVSNNIIGADCENILKRNKEDPNMLPALNHSLHQGSFGDYVADYSFESVQPAGSFNSSMNAEFEEARRNVNNSVINSNVASDMGESSIISNILSIKLDAWEDSLALPQSLVKLLGESEEQQVPFKVPAILKVHDKNQSRFSFAREDDFDNETSVVEHHVGDDMIDCSTNCLFSTNAVGTNDVNSGKLRPSFSSSNVDSNNCLSVSKNHGSTPPGFSMLSRMPPGFASRLRADQDLGNYAKLLQQGYATPTSNIGAIDDFEFHDPAIAKVGMGTLADRQTNRSFDTTRNTFSQLNPYEDNSSLKLLTQQSLSQQNFRYTDHIGNKLSSNDSYKKYSRILDQFHVCPNNSSVYDHLAFQQFNNPHTTNGHLVGWNDFENFGEHNISDIIDGESMRFNRFVSSYENDKFGVSAFADPS